MNSIDRLYGEEIPAIVISEHGEVSELLPVKPLVLSGSFNPLHDGHREMLSVASDLTGKIGYYEISIQNVDKAPLPRQALGKRAEQIADEGKSLIVTNAARFTEKSSIFPGADFVIGFDTLVRLLDKKYYPDHVSVTTSPVYDSLNLIRQNGCRFVVAGRIDIRLDFKEFVQSTAPARFQKMFIGLSESQFRSDISSTELRDRII